MTTDLDRDFEAAERRFTEDLRNETPTEMDYTIRDALRLAVDLKAQAEREQEMLKNGEATMVRVSVAVSDIGTVGIAPYDDWAMAEELADVEPMERHAIARHEISAVVPIPKHVEIKGKVSARATGESE